MNRMKKEHHTIFSQEPELNASWLHPSWITRIPVEFCEMITFWSSCHWNTSLFLPGDDDEKKEERKTRKWDSCKEEGLTKRRTSLIGVSVRSMSHISPSLCLPFFLLFTSVSIATIHGKLVIQFIRFAQPNKKNGTRMVIERKKSFPFRRGMHSVITRLLYREKSSLPPSDQRRTSQKKSLLLSLCPSLRIYFQSTSFHRSDLLV